MKRIAAVALIPVATLAVVTAARAGTIKVLPLSQQYGPSRAAISARIRASGLRRGRTENEQQAATTSVHRAHGATSAPIGGTGEKLPPPYPPLASTAAILHNPQPAGPGSFWYGDGGGHLCMYAPDSVLPCFTVVAPAGNAAAGTLAPEVLAASVTRRLELAPGSIEASPARTGLTGADSWFWLEPAPRTETLSVTLAGEQVTVTAEPQVVWRFGDGATFTGGAGVAYRPGPPPPEAVWHVYQTRCLPDDQGRDPYVLASCGSDGYQVQALVGWRISYQAAGPVAATGDLPARTTETALVYPVSEARAFLVNGASG